MRAFIALELPELDRAVRWPRPPERHLTLRFLGEVPESALAGLEAALHRTALSVAPFELSLRGGGAFPDPERPRVAWVGIGEGAEPLARLERALTAELASAGVPPAPPPFGPHGPVLRVRSPADRAAAGRLLADLVDRTVGRLHVEEAVLFESQLAPGAPARHRPRARVRLAAGPAPAPPGPPG